MLNIWSELLAVFLPVCHGFCISKIRRKCLQLTRQEVNRQTVCVVLQCKQLSDMSTAEVEVSFAV